MERWESDRVAQGGIFHPATAKYSPETRQLIKDLIQESRFASELRQKTKYSLRSNEPLSHGTKSKIEKPNVIFKTGFSKRRQFNAIVESGVYQPEKFVPVQKGFDRDQAKKYLQDVMEFGKESKIIPKLVKKDKDEPKEPINRFEELKQEIQEREDWLSEMEALGEGHKYQSIIQEQIAARIREMKSLKTHP